MINLFCGSIQDRKAPAVPVSSSLHAMRTPVHPRLPPSLSCQTPNYKDPNANRYTQQDSWIRRGRHVLSSAMFFVCSSIVLSLLWWSSGQWLCPFQRRLRRWVTLRYPAPLRAGCPASCHRWRGHAHHETDRQRNAWFFYLDAKMQSSLGSILCMWPFNNSFFFIKARLLLLTTTIHIFHELKYTFTLFNFSLLPRQNSHFS